MQEDKAEKLRIVLQGQLLDEKNVFLNPLNQFQKWYDDARQAEIENFNAMALASSTKEGIPSVRMVLLKEINNRGFVFYTNYESKKAQDIEVNPNVSLLFYWKEIERQVRIQGSISRVSRQETEKYFLQRTRESQIESWASHQSGVLANRQGLDDAYLALEKKFLHKFVPCPEFWGGYRVSPVLYEFWQGRLHRLHDRIRYQKKDDSWAIDRLSP